MCKAKSKSLSKYVPHLFCFFPMQEFKYDLQDFLGEFHCTKAPPLKKKKSKKRILLGLNYGTFLCKLTFCFALFLTVGQL